MALTHRQYVALRFVSFGQDENFNLIKFKFDLI